MPLEFVEFFDIIISFLCGNDSPLLRENAANSKILTLIILSTNYCPKYLCFIQYTIPAFLNFYCNRDFVIA